MNRLNFVQTGGYPIKAERLKELQDAFEIFNGLGAILGTTAIVSGCQVNGTQTADGVVYYNGELYNFVGGTTQNEVVIVEVETSRPFNDGTTKVVHTANYITFGSGTGAISWANFKRTNSLQEIESRILPPGTNPQLYCGAINAIPTGWQLCDGTNGTPDLRGQFIVAYNPNDTDYDAIGKTGGAKQVALTEAQMPTHNHSGTTSSSGTHTHSIQHSTSNSGGNVAANSGVITHNNNLDGNMSTTSAGAHTHSLTINNAGLGQAHENRPPYYTLAYIIYTGN